MALYRLEAFPPQPREMAVCLGMFDGVHLGHQQLIQETCAAAALHHLDPCAFTFDIAPAFVLRPDKKSTLLTPIEEKSRLMHLYGLKHVIYTHFDESIANLSAQAFFEDILLNQLHVRHIVVGFHYHFGKNAEGDSAKLQSLCLEHGIGLTIISPVTASDGSLVSSTAIRQALETHQPARAAQLLGRSVDNE